MLEKYLQQTEFTDFEDFKANYKLLVPENFNFGYDNVDAWAAKEPNKKAKRSIKSLYKCKPSQR